MNDDSSNDVRGFVWPANSLPNYRDGKFVVYSSGQLPCGFEQLQHAKEYAISLLPAKVSIRDNIADVTIYDEENDGEGSKDEFDDCDGTEIEDD